MDARLLRWRDRLIDRLLGLDQTVLNASLPTRGREDDVLARLEATMADLERLAVCCAGARVDYRAAAQYLAVQRFQQELGSALAAFDPGALTDLRQQLSFWINLFNLLVIHAVIAFNVRRSITEGPLGVLRFFRRAAYRVAGQRMSLEDIEQGVLRANRGHPYLPGAQFAPEDPRRAWVVAPLDPRIHWGLNCASRSCPPLQAYRTDAVDLALDAAGQAFIAAHVQVQPEAGAVHVSAIFNWYQKDFGGKSGILAYVHDNLPEGYRRDWIQANRFMAKVKFQPYDWGLNASAPAG